MTTSAERAFFGQRVDLTRPPKLPAWVAEAVEQNADIRTLNQVALKLMRVLDEPMSSAVTVERALQGDVGLASRVLRVANSGFYGGAAPTCSVRQAIARVGFESVRAIALATAMHQENILSGEVGTRLAKHSVGVGVLARLLAHRQRKADPDLAFMAGLLHDIGKFALLQCFPDDYQRITDTAKAAGWSRTELEHRVFGCDHADVGAALTYSWGLPPRLLFAVRLHHDLGTLYANDPDPWSVALVSTVRLADDILHANSTGDGEMATDCAPIASEALDVLGFDQDMLSRLWPELLQHYQEASLVLL